MKKNIKEVKLKLTFQGLYKFQNVPTFKNLLHQNQIDNLHVGINILQVNHYISSKIARVVGYDSDNMSIIES